MTSEQQRIYTIAKPYYLKTVYDVKDFSACPSGSPLGTIDDREVFVPNGLLLFDNYSVSFLNVF